VITSGNIADISGLTDSQIPDILTVTKLAGITTNGFVKTSAGDGTLTFDTNTYLTGNQTITLSGDVTGSGATGITTAIGANKVTDAMLRQSSGLSIIGRSASTTGNVADLTGTADQLLRVNGAGTVLGFGAVDLSKSAAVGTSILSPANGGTGVANNAASTLAISGNFGTTLTVSGTTAVTLPTSGTLVSSVTTGNGVSATNTAGALAFTLGAITPSTVNGLTITANGTNTLNIAAGKTLGASNSLTLAGTDGTTMTFPTTSASIARTDAAQSFTGLQTFNGGISSANNVTLTGLTASKVVFTDGSKNLTSTGIGTSGQFLKGDGSLDSSTYLTAEADTLSSVTGRGASTSNALTLTGGATVRGLTVDTATATDDKLALTPFVGGSNSFTGSFTSADLTAARTYTFPDASGTVITSGNIADISGLTDSQIPDILTETRWQYTYHYQMKRKQRLEKSWPLTKTS
jgi:hypothetical protein